MAAEEERFRRMVRPSAGLSELQISSILSSKWNPWKSERIERTAAKMRDTNKRTSYQNRSAKLKFKH
jgi:hypothetical protein